MTKWARSGALFLGAGTLFLVVVAVPALPVQAQAGTPTQITVSVAPNPASDQEQVTVSGTLETAGSPAQPLPQPVDLTIPGEGTVSVKTSAAGAFAYQYSAVLPGEITASYPGNATYAGSSNDVYLLPATPPPTRIVLDPITPTPYLGVATVSGTVQMQSPGGSWVPSPDAPILTCDGTEQISTGMNGKFVTAVQANPAATCILKTTQSPTSWSGDATIRVVVPLAAFPTWACKASGPSVTPSPIRHIELSTGFCYEDSSGGAQPLAHQLVQLYYRAPSATRVRLMASAYTDSQGLVQVSVSGYLPGGALAAGDWIWSVPASTHYLSSSTPAFGVAVSVPASLRRVRIRSPHHRPRLVGRLGYLKRRGPVARAKVVIQRFRRGHWRRAGTTRSRATGAFTFRLNRRRTGRYRVLFRGSHLPGAQAAYGDFLACRSAAVRLR